MLNINSEIQHVAHTVGALLNPPPTCCKCWLSVSPSCPVLWRSAQPPVLTDWVEDSETPAPHVSVGQAVVQFTDATTATQERNHNWHITEPSLTPFTESCFPPSPPERPPSMNNVHTDPFLRFCLQTIQTLEVILRQVSWTYFLTQLRLSEWIQGTASEQMYFDE